MFCRSCGHEINPNDKFCRNCGSSIDEFVTVNAHHSDSSIDRGSVGLGVLSFFFPLAGLILFLCWRKEKPLTAKHCGIGALISIIINVIAFVLVCILLANVFSGQIIVS